FQGNLSQPQRDAALSGFRDGRFKVLVATDIAARGLDIPQVSHVINYDLPQTAEAFTHRSGRTGRANKSGIVISFSSSEDRKMLAEIIKLNKTEFVKIHGKESNAPIAKKQPKTYKPSTPSPKMEAKKKFDSKQRGKKTARTSNPS
ncbi:MAG: helicase-related protein, partial [Cetobacterium sp.]